MDTETLIPWFDDEQPMRPQKRPIKQNEFVIELAFHEASHFVLGRLVNKLEIGFKHADSILIDSIDRKGGEVSGFGGDFQSEVVYWTNSNRQRFTNFFTKDEKRIWADSLVLIAGYASYKLFVSDQEDFISYIESDEWTEIEMHSIKTVPHHYWYTQVDKYLVGVSDFAKIKERLAFIGIIESEDRIENYNLLLEAVSDIMKTRAVELAIRYVKNRLKAADGNKIEGSAFEQIVCFTDNLISKIDISGVIRHLANRSV